MELQEIISVVFSLVGSLVLVCLAVLIGIRWITFTCCFFRSIRSVCMRVWCGCVSRPVDNHLQQFALFAANDFWLGKARLWSSIDFVNFVFVFSRSLVSGWYLVWKFFLSRFRLVRELLGHMHDNSTPTHNTYEKENNKKSKAKKIRRDWKQGSTCDTCTQGDGTYIRNDLLEQKQNI